MRRLFVEYLSKIMLLIVYGKDWKDKLDTMKSWIPTVLTMTSFAWLFSLFFLWIGAGNSFWYCLIYAVVYPVVIIVWAIYERNL